MDFDESSQKLIPPEFLAVVLAGFGNEAPPAHRQLWRRAQPKGSPAHRKQTYARVPAHVLLICPTSHRAALSNYIQSDSSASFPSLNIDLQTFEESQDLSGGTSTILRHFAHRIQQDFVLLPCDFVPPPSLSLTQILNKFRTESTYDGAIATACFYEGRKPDKGSSADEWGPAPAPTPIVWDERSETLLHIDTPDDADRNGEGLELRMGLLSKYPRVKLSATLLDSHVYACRRQVLDALLEKTSFDSIREEFVPWLCKPQYQRTKLEKYGRVLNPVTNALTQELALKHSTLHSKAPVHLAHEEAFLHSPPSDDQTQEHTKALLLDEDDEEARIPASLRMGLVIHRAQAGYAARANNLHAYLGLNRHFLSQQTYALPSDSESRSKIDPKSTISPDSIVGHSTRVEERTSIKKSVVGKHCVIGKMVKIAGCVIQDHCVIADGAKLDGCILGKGTKVGEKAELSRCVTQCGYEVGAGETVRNEKLDISDWTAAPESSEDDNQSEEEGSSEESDD
ncbi:hypothetical protein EVJ58_g9769 [Rhodofomes roseus]|uniref:Translation initiation factor eIF2B subunit gamma n=1 Tax=Rhodofomes roseus TaxID=34475 RepID=A0A4Y9XRV7_9APHY|nr:hypothetical protein EVJ58_g9769 [Rhodofomes roseus]